MASDPEVSVVIPVYESKKTLPELDKKLAGVFESNEISYEVIYVDDGSRQETWNELEKIYERNARTKIVKLSKNFGQHNATMCGFRHAEGEYIITLDDDLQHPPKEIPALLSEIKKGYDLVYGTYKNKKHSPGRNLGSKLVQFYYQRIFGHSHPISSFRIITKDLVENILEYDKSFTYIDGLLAWFTDNVSTVEVQHKECRYGNSEYTLGKLVRLSINMLTNFSIIPLKVASFLGAIFSVVGFSLATYYLIKKLFFGIPQPGFTTIVVTITFFSGVQLLTIGLIGEYLGRVHLNLNKRPQYRIEEIKSENLDNDD